MRGRKGSSQDTSAIATLLDYVYALLGMSDESSPVKASQLRLSEFCECYGIPRRKARTLFECFGIKTGNVYSLEELVHKIEAHAKSIDQMFFYIPESQDTVARLILKMRELKAKDKTRRLHKNAAVFSLPKKKLSRGRG